MLTLMKKGMLSIKIIPGQLGLGPVSKISLDRKKGINIREVIIKKQENIILLE